MATDMRTLFLLAALLATEPLFAQDTLNPLRGDLIVHDPVMIAEKGRYYIFHTGKGIPYKTSTDRIHWKDAGSVFDTLAMPAWHRKHIPNQDAAIWAPDIHYFNGKYYLYYSVSAWMNFNSSIGLATNVTLDPKDPRYHWKDEGDVVNFQNGGEGVNVIDPNAYRDEKGGLWLFYGSYKAGLRLLPLDPKSGLRADTSAPIVITKALGEGVFVISGPQYHYIFASRGRCCAGMRSNYQMVMGRSESLEGPFLTTAGKSWVDNQYTLFLAGDSTEPGRGHNGFFTQGDTTFIVYHAYSRARNGAPVLRIRPLYLDAAGWPTLDASQPLFRRRKGTYTTGRR
jgi:arabinan endo-1,5-alpha-L-arabinosidase